MKCFFSCELVFITCIDALYVISDMLEYRKIRFGDVLMILQEKRDLGRMIVVMLGDGMPVIS